jgi:uncharacterized protein YoxC
MSTTLATAVNNLTRLILAASLAYLGYSIIHISQQVSKLEPIIKEVNDVQLQIPQILQRVDNITAEIPLILAQVESVVTQIDPILKRVDDITEQVPPLLEQIHAVEQQITPILVESKQIRKAIPPVLKQVDNTNKSVQQVSKQIPAILKESAALRADTPKAIAEAQLLVDNVKEAGKEASEGVVSGVLSGILKAPLSVLPSITTLFSGVDLSDKDQQLMNEAVLSTLVNNKIGEKNSWFNSQTNIAGEVTLLPAKQNSSTCRTLQIELKKARRTINSEKIEVCQDSNGKWEV